METPEEQIAEKFSFRCIGCGSSDVGVDFSQGGGFCPSPALGWLKLTCRGCGEILEVEDGE